MAKNKRICQICGSPYDFCPNCNSHINYPRWMISFHSENCKNIWIVINDYKAGALDAIQAKSKLSQLDLSEKDTFNKYYKNMINGIMSTEVPEKKTESESVNKNYSNSESKYNSKKNYKK